MKMTEEFLMISREGVLSNFLPDSVLFKINAKVRETGRILSTYLQPLRSKDKCSLESSTVTVQVSPILLIKGNQVTFYCVDVINYCQNMVRCS